MWFGPRPGTSLTPADIDPDLDPERGTGAPAAGRSRGPRERAIVAVVAVGGVIGAESRHGVDLAIPHADGGFPWSTLVVNASGCLLIGTLLAVLAGITVARPLVRPFLAVGVLGGYTTFSGFAVDVERLVRLDQLATATAYLLATLLVCAGAVWAATAATRAALSVRRM